MFCKRGRWFLWAVPGRQHCGLSICEYWLSLTNTETAAATPPTVMQNFLRASAQWLVLESAVVLLISSPMYVKSLIGAFLCSFVHHSKSGKGFSLSFSQFYHSWLPQIWGTVVFVGYLTVGFVLGLTTYISPGLFTHFSHSSAVLEKVFLSKLPLLNCPNSGKCIFTSVSVVDQYFSVFHNQVPLQTALCLAPFWRIFSTDCAKD